MNEENKTKNENKNFNDLKISVIWLHLSFNYFAIINFNFKEKLFYKNSLIIVFFNNKIKSIHKSFWNVNKIMWNHKLMRELNDKKHELFVKNNKF